MWPVNDRREMDQAVQGDERRARDCGWPVSRAPGANPKGGPGDEKRRADIQDKVRVIGASVGRPRNPRVPERAIGEHREPVQAIGQAEDCCYQSLHQNLLDPRRPGGGKRDIGFEKSGGLKNSGL